METPLIKAVMAAATGLEVLTLAVTVEAAGIASDQKIVALGVPEAEGEAAVVVEEAEAHPAPITEGKVDGIMTKRNLVSPTATVASSSSKAVVPWLAPTTEVLLNRVSINHPRISEHNSNNSSIKCTINKRQRMLNTRSMVSSSSTMVSKHSNNLRPHPLRL